MLLKRALLALCVTLLTLLLAEGVHSLATGRSLRATAGFARLLPALARRDARPAPSGAPLAPPTDAERHAAVVPSTGLYQLDEDPRVRHVLRADAALEILGTAHTDHLGLRVRPGPPPPEDALRIAIVGDSVAFGFGVNDDETEAAALERILDAVRGPGVRPVACTTVAVPSWNHRNALAFLTDYWNELRPDIVVYVPIANDLDDATSVYESGRMHLEPDPAQPDPWLYVSRTQLDAVEQALLADADGRKLEPADPGPRALMADITPESRRRFDDNAASIASMGRLLAAHGGKLLVTLSEQDQYTWSILARLQRLAPELPVMMLETSMPREFTLGSDPHPNARTLQVRAQWVATELLERGWIDRGAGNPVPETPPEYLAVRAQPSTPELVEHYAGLSRRKALLDLLSEIDFTTGKGLRQVVGGLNLDRSVRMHALFVLKAGGPGVRIELAPLTQRGDLYPLPVDVEIAGVPVGSLTIEALKSTNVTLPLPASVAPGEAFEVKLIPRTWCVLQQRDGSEVAAFRPVRLTCQAR